MWTQYTMYSHCYICMCVSVIMLVAQRYIKATRLSRCDMWRHHYCPAVLDIAAHLSRICVCLCLYSTYISMVVCLQAPLAKRKVQCNAANCSVKCEAPGHEGWVGGVSQRHRHRCRCRRRYESAKCATSLRHMEKNIIYMYIYIQRVEPESGSVLCAKVGPCNETGTGANCASTLYT